MRYFEFDSEQILSCIKKKRVKRSMCDTSVMKSHRNQNENTQIRCVWWARIILTDGFTGLWAIYNMTQRLLFRAQNPEIQRTVPMDSTVEEMYLLNVEKDCFSLELIDLGVKHLQILLQSRPLHL